MSKPAVQLSLTVSGARPVLQGPQLCNHCVGSPLPSQHGGSALTMRSLQERKCQHGLVCYSCT